METQMKRSDCHGAHGPQGPDKSVFAGTPFNRSLSMDPRSISSAILSDIAIWLLAVGVIVFGAYVVLV